MAVAQSHKSLDGKGVAQAHVELLAEFCSEYQLTQVAIYNIYK